MMVSLRYISTASFTVNGVAFAAASNAADANTLNRVSIFANGQASACSASVTSAARTQITFALDGDDTTLSQCGLAAGDDIFIAVSVVDAVNSLEVVRNPFAVASFIRDCHEAEARPNHHLVLTTTTPDPRLRYSCLLYTSPSPRDRG